MRTGNPERRREAEGRGRRGEAFAALLLRCKGYRILGQRVRTRAGEIDLVARSPSGIVCFVEVKTRPDGPSPDIVGPRQRARILRAAGLFLAGKRRPKAIRFDVITVVPGRLPRHRRDAWRADGS